MAYYNTLIPSSLHYWLNKIQVFYLNSSKTIILNKIKWLANAPQSWNQIALKLKHTYVYNAKQFWEKI